MCPNATVGGTGEGGGDIREVCPMFRVFGQTDRRGKVASSKVREVRWMNGLRSRIRLVVLSNFHIENIFIRVTV